MFVLLFDYTCLCLCVFCLFILNIVHIINVGIWARTEGVITSLVHVVVGVLVLVAGHIARLVDDVLATGNAFALAGLVKTLLGRASVLGRIRQSVDGGRRFASLNVECEDKLHICMFKSSFIVTHTDD